MKMFMMLLALSATTLFAIGCDDKTPPKPANPAEEHTDHDDDHSGHEHGENHADHDESSHASHDESGHASHDEGEHDHSPKHGGHLIELGHNHAYHAELVDNHKTESVTVYLMDTHMEPLSIPAASITLALTSGDETKSFKLLGVQPGGASEFSSNDAEMMKMMESDEVKIKLRAMIDGASINGSLDHSGHGHDEAGHEGHDHAP